MARHVPTVLAAGWLIIALTACGVYLPPTPKPTQTLSGPAIAPTITVLPYRVTDVPPDQSVEGQNDPTAAALPRWSALPPLAVGAAGASGVQPVAISAEDGTQLSGELYQGGAVRLPGVLLLASDHKAWGDFPAKIQAAGFTVLSIDMRATAPLADFGVLILSLSSGEADPARLAVIGAGPGADMALMGCSGELLCDTVILLSPSNQPAVLNALAGFTPRPLLVSASQDDANSFAAMLALQSAAKGEMQMQPFDHAGHGTDMLTSRPDLGDLMIQWLKRHLGAK